MFPSPQSNTTYSTHIVLHIAKTQLLILCFAVMKFQMRKKEKKKNRSNQEQQVCPLLKIFGVNINNLWIITHDNSAGLLLWEPNEQG